MSWSFVFSSSCIELTPNRFAHYLASERVDNRPGLPRDEEKHVIGPIEVFDNRLTPLVVPPATALLNTLQGLGGNKATSSRECCGCIRWDCVIAAAPGLQNERY